MRALIQFIVNLLIVLTTILIIAVTALYISGMDGIAAGYGGTSYGIADLFGISIFIWIIIFLIVTEFIFFALRSLMRRKAP